METILEGEMWKDGSFADFLYRNYEKFEQEDELEEFGAATPGISTPDIIWSQSQRKLKEVSPSDIIERLEKVDDNDLVEEKSVFWNSLPKKLKELVKSNYIDSLKGSTITRETCVKLLEGMGYNEPIVVKFVNETIGKEVSFSNVHFLVGTMISCCIDAKKSQ